MPKTKRGKMYPCCVHCEHTDTSYTDHSKPCPECNLEQQEHPIHQTVLDDWKRLCCDKSESIDVDGPEHDWFTLWIGFAIGRGIEYTVATNYTIYLEHVFPLERA